MNHVLNLNDQWVIEAAVRRVLLDACKPGGVLRVALEEVVREVLAESSASMSVDGGDDYGTC